MVCCVIGLDVSRRVKTMSSPKTAFIAGAQAMVPLTLGALPFAVIAGLSAVGVGLSKFAALGMSHLVFAGAAQLAIIDLISRQASDFVIILTALVINLRFCVYSASLAPHFQQLPLTWRSGLAYLITDQSFAISISAFDLNIKEFKHWYYLGGALTMWATWHIGTVAGVFLGAQVPKEWGLDFAIPLTFLALLFPAIKDSACLIAAAVAGSLALLCHPLPYNLGLFIATLAGIGAGYLVSRRKRHA